MNIALKNQLLPDCDIPAYSPSGQECALFESAWVRQLPLLLKGPTGCGKTRFVAHMAAKLGLPLATVSCHDDLAAADLTGRYLLKGGDTVWVDGPLTRAVREGGICYLDEIVEARKDVAVVLHPLTDDRRILPLERTGEVLEAPSGFMLVVSYNPGYQNLLKSLKPSTRQRFVAIEFDFLPRDRETAVVSEESGLDEARVAPLVNLAHRLRALKGHDLEEIAMKVPALAHYLIGAGRLFDSGFGILLVPPEPATMFVAEGWSKADIANALFGKASRSTGRKSRR